MSVIQNEAYVTLVTSDSYVIGAGVLAKSLQNTGTRRMIWCLASKKLSMDSLNVLRAIFMGVTEVDCLDSEDVANLALLGRPELGQTFTKLHLWQLTQFNKVVFLDADTMILKNIDDLFEREEFSACADVGWPDCFNSGVFVARPSEETFGALTKLARDEGSFDGGDQGLLNSYFSDWSTGPSSRRIPFTYNLTINASYSYAPAYARFKNDVKVVHFIGTNKPWTFYRLTDGSVVPRGADSSQGQGANLDYIQMWWNICDEFLKSLQTNHSISFIPNYNVSRTSDANEVIKVYAGASGSPSSTFSSRNAMNKQDMDINPEADFASYRIKWNADVERYFSSAKNGNHKASQQPAQTSQQPLSPKQKEHQDRHQFLTRNNRHQSHQVKNYRVLGDEGANQEDETFYDDRYYSDD